MRRAARLHDDGRCGLPPQCCHRHCETFGKRGIFTPSWVGLHTAIRKVRRDGRMAAALPPPVGGYQSTTSALLLAEIRNRANGSVSAVVLNSGQHSQHLALLLRQRLQPKHHCRACGLHRKFLVFEHGAARDTAKDALGKTLGHRLGSATRAELISHHRSGKGPSGLGLAAALKI